MVNAHSLVIAVYFLLTDVNECTTENGGCHDQCCNTIGSYHCKCPAGQKLEEDGKSCGGNVLYCVSLLLRNQRRRWKGKGNVSFYLEPAEERILRVVQSADLLMSGL